ncbi:MAG: hypothetical protein HYZ91_02005 [Candidatus Omnitrophica bacterium]|nr:hypothetical protein [Candidatus Omnitrophota bacterium]
MILDVRRAWYQMARMLGSHWRLWIPFGIIAAVEALMIGLVWLAPMPPYSTVLAPPIRYVFGERFLHYPWHLWFVYYAMRHAYLAASVVIGAFMSGVACVMVWQTHTGQRLSFREALLSRRVRYGTVLILWGLTWAAARGAVGMLVRTAPAGSAWLFWAIVALTVGLQTLFAYAIPAAVFTGAPWWRALLQGFREVTRYPMSTLLMVLVPLTAVIGFSVAVPENRLAAWMVQTVPEIAVFCIIGRWLVMMAADALLTVGIAHLWWIHRAQDVPSLQAQRSHGRARSVPRGFLKESPVAVSASD